MTLLFYQISYFGYKKMNLESIKHEYRFTKTYMNNKWTVSFLWLSLLGILYIISTIYSKNLSIYLYIYIYIYIYIYMIRSLCMYLWMCVQRFFFLLAWVWFTLFCLVLWHIIHCTLFNTKSIFKQLYFKQFSLT